MKLLILEDDPVVCAALETAITPTWPFDIQLVPTCSDAIFQLSGPHYIPFFLADLNLPDGDGMNVLKVAFERGLLAFTQSAIMTACASPDHVRRARAIGVQQFLVKPVQPALIQAELANRIDCEIRMAGSASDLLSRLQQLDAKCLTDLQVSQMYQLSVLAGCHSVGRALTRLRQYLAKPYRKNSEIEDAWLALKQQCEFLAKSSPVSTQGVKA